MAGTTPEDNFLAWAVQNSPEILPRLPKEIFSRNGLDKLSDPTNIHVLSSISEVQAQKFLRNQLLALTAKQAATAQKTGRLNDLLSTMDLLEECHSGFGKLPIDAFDLIVPIPREVIPTGIAPLDKQIQGLARGELGIIFMPPGRGKTNLLINFAVSALRNGYSVHYITVADQGKQELVPRIDTCILGSPGHPSMSEKDLQDRHALAIKTLKHRLWISDFTAQECSIDNIERVIDHCESDLVIVDHADDVLSPYSHDPTVTRHSLRVVYLALKKLGVRYDLPIWTASQSSELSWFMTRTGVADMSEAKVGKATGAAIILGFSGGPAHEQQLGIVYCTIAKARRFYTEMIFPLRCDFTKMRVW